MNLLPSMRSDYQYGLLASHEESSLTAFEDDAFAQGIKVDEFRWGELNNRPRKRLGYRTPAQVFLGEYSGALNTEGAALNA